MAVRIRLMRRGSKRRPFYRFVVADSRGKRDGGFLDQIGHYNPIEQPHKIEVDEDKVFEWLGKGAQMSEGARSLLKKTGTLARWDAKRTGREAPQKTFSTKAAPPAAAPAEAVAPEGAVAEKAPAEAVAPEGAVAEKAPAEEVAPAEVVAEAAPAEEVAPAEVVAEAAPVKEVAPAEVVAEAAPAEAVAPEAAVAEKAPAEQAAAEDAPTEVASAEAAPAAGEAPTEEKPEDKKETDSN